jgi:zinc transporter, ZIP family
VSLSQTLLLGLIAGATIFLGLPLGRLRTPAPGLRVLLNAMATGVLVFLLWDVLSAAWEPIDTDLSALSDGGGFAPVLGYGLLFAGGLAVGLLGLVEYETWMQRRAKRPVPPIGPGAMSVTEVAERRTRSVFGFRRPPAGAAHRHRDRAAQLRRGSGDRPVRRTGRDRARDGF